MFSLIRYWIFRLGSALRWYWRAETRYDVHSPFLSEFVREVYHDDRTYYAFQLIRHLRAYWDTRKDSVGLQSLGAKSRTTRRSRRSVASLVRSNAIGRRAGEFLFRLALWHRPSRIVELGTNAGISTLYLHAADTRIPLHTVEGNPEVAALATETFRRAGVSPQLRSFTATFREYLDNQLPKDKTRLLAFIDGDHRHAPTIAYVTRLLEVATDDSIIVVADIHWSRGMETAWKELKQLPRVTASIDTYHFGILFLRPELRGPHRALIRTRFKPWRVGFFS
ncbi:putative O-methyltransferase YrrM [Lewinella aquimaris]|uniref:Putative O-methyltransferase YrrM n=1 Tax=Neolewinella aquimaris TaxID=1835722 RepID=A0A840E6A5_9BACT|nr:class I SAM-dependent methyltransferase [Neolewinella aquimaris]MBB4080711.1 putative O-methyltransferase YrrM [Neolewinella aquimaris]